MAKITLSDVAPAEAVHFTFAGGEFDLGGSGKKSYETSDSGVIGEALAHPWLSVEFPKVEAVATETPSPFPAPKDDPMSREGSIDANDPAEVAKANEAQAAPQENLVALDVGKTQTEAVSTGPVAETLAADDTSKTSEKAGK